VRREARTNAQVVKDDAVAVPAERTARDWCAKCLRRVDRHSSFPTMDFGSAGTRKSQAERDSCVAYGNSTRDANDPTLWPWGGHRRTKKQGPGSAAPGPCKGLGSGREGESARPA